MTSVVTALYAIVSGRSSDELEERVNERLSDGWGLRGNVVYGTNPDVIGRKNPVWTQVMMKVEMEEEEEEDASFWSWPFPLSD